jgi:hypothetical protein
MRKLLFLLAGCVVGALLAVFALRQEFRGTQTSSTLPEIPVCDLLPEREPDNVVSLRVSRIENHPGIVCVRVYNGTPNFARYEWESIRLERHWFGLVWLPHLSLSDFLLVGRGRLVGGVELVLYPGKHRDFYSSPFYEPAPPNTYRVRFRYRLTSEEEELTVYSEEFVLP